ncbi:MAG: peptidylprolyl isomerase, partial [Cyanobacteria bacterium J06632_22]
VIDQQPISVGHAFMYLQSFGRLQPFIQNLMRYHVLLKEIQVREQRRELQVSAADLSQALIDFRLQNQLAEQGDFQSWLLNQGLSYEALERQLLIGMKLNQLRTAVTSDQIEASFDAQRDSFDQVDLYYMLVSEEKLAGQLKEQLEAGDGFEKVALDFPLGEGKVVVKRDVLRRSQLRPEIQSATADASLNTLIGPILMGDRWCLCRVEQVLPAVLSESLKAELTEQLFDAWVTEQMAALSVSAAEAAPAQEVVPPLDTEPPALREKPEAAAPDDAVPPPPPPRRQPRENPEPVGVAEHE